MQTLLQAHRSACKECAANGPQERPRDRKEESAHFARLLANPLFPRHIRATLWLLAPTLPLPSRHCVAAFSLVLPCLLHRSLLRLICAWMIAASSCRRLSLPSCVRWSPHHQEAHPRPSPCAALDAASFGRRPVLSRFSTVHRIAVRPTCRRVKQLCKPVPCVPVGGSTRMLRIRSERRMPKTQMHDNAVLSRENILRRSFGGVEIGSLVLGPTRRLHESVCSGAARMIRSVARPSSSDDDAASERRRDQDVPTAGNGGRRRQR